MPAPSDDFETADYAQLRACSLAARGLMTDMRVLMRKSKRFGFLHLEGKPISLAQVARLAGCAADEVHPLVEELIAVGLLKHGERDGYFSPRMVSYASFTEKCSAAGKKGGGNPKLRTTEPIKVPVKDAQKVGEKDGLNDPPPMVSLSTPLSSLSPSPLSPGEAIEVPESVRLATYAAFDQWSSVSRGYALDAMKGEHRKVALMLDALAGETPIIRNGEAVGRHLLAAKAADLAKRNGKDFTTVAYACGIVKAELERWETKGIPGATAPKGKANGTPAPRESARGTTVLGRV